MRLASISSKRLSPIRRNENEALSRQVPRITMKSLLKEEARAREAISNEFNVGRARWIVAMADSADRAANKLSLRGGRKTLKAVRDDAELDKRPDTIGLAAGRSSLARHIVSTAIANVTRAPTHSKAVPASRVSRVISPYLPAYVSTQSQPYTQGYDPIRTPLSGDRPVAPLAAALLSISEPPQSSQSQRLITSAPSATDQPRQMTPFERIKQRAANQLRAEMGEEQVAEVLLSIGEKGEFRTQQGRPARYESLPSAYFHEMEGVTAGDPDLEGLHSPMAKEASNARRHPMGLSDNAVRLMESGHRQRSREGTTARQRLLADPNFLLNHKAKLAMFEHIYTSSSQTIRQLTTRRREMERHEEAAKVADHRLNTRSQGRSGSPLAGHSTSAQLLTLPPLRGHQLAASTGRQASPLPARDPSVSRFLTDYHKAEEARSRNKALRETKTKAFKYRLNERDWWMAESKRMGLNRPDESPKRHSPYQQIGKALEKHRSGQLESPPKVPPAADEEPVPPQL